jgi:hypothetical protein
MSAAVLILWPNDKPSTGRLFNLTTEDRYEPGWVGLVRHVRCPAGCAGGEVLAGGDLVQCSVSCDGGVVLVGVGGARVRRSTPFPLPEEPSETYFDTELTDIVLTSQVTA